MDQITRDELRELLDTGSPLTIVEVLPAPYFRKAHLPGAINIPSDQVMELAPSMLPGKDAAIVVYCADLACPNSARVAQVLAELGYADVRDYAEGKQDWIAAGLPTENHRGQRSLAIGTGVASEAVPGACSLGTADLAARAASVRHELFSGVQEWEDLPDGYAFRFPGDEDWKDRIENFVGTERRCCSFFRIDVTYEPGLGPIWLKLTGPSGTREFVQQNFALTSL